MERIVIVAISVLVFISTVESLRVNCPEGYSLTQNLRRCYKQSGFSYKPGSPFINAHQLVKYCRRTDKPNPTDCISEAWSRCNGDWTETEIEDFRKEMKAVKPAFNYLCSEAEALESNRRCIDEAVGGMRDCLLFGERKAQQQLESLRDSGTLSTEDESAIMEQFGHTAVTCVFNVATSQCDKKVAAIFGNFIYGIYVSPYVRGNIE